MQQLRLGAGAGRPHRHKQRQQVFFGRMVLHGRRRPVAVVEQRCAVACSETVPLSYGQHRLATIIGDYTQAYPEVQLDIALSDRKVDLVEDGFDLAVRIGELPQSDLIARKLGGVRSIVCASPGYVARHGAPNTPQELGGHACLGYSLTGSGTDWRFETPDGPLVVPITGPIRADNGDIIRLAALSGAGILFQPHFIVGADLAAGRLVQLLPQWQSADLGVYAVYPSRKHLSAKVRTFVDFLAAALDT